MNYTLPTSSDIYLEVNGRKLAVVESYRAFAMRSSKNIEAFGESEPVATLPGRVSYTLELSRVVVLKNAGGDGVDFFSLRDFNVVIVKPDCRIVYSGCEWSGITEAAGLNDTVTEMVKVIAAKRMVIS